MSCSHRRVAADPLGQTIVFELMMRLFFLHVLGVRPECLQNRRHVPRTYTREWVTDGVAAASVTPGIFGLVHAFRGEIEAQGRGSLHPHILVWLVGIDTRVLLAMIQGNPGRTREVLRGWMRAVVRAVESTSQSSVRTVHRQFGEYQKVGPELTLNTAQQSLCRYDGGSEVDELAQDLAQSAKQASESQQQLIDNEKDLWERPNLPTAAVQPKTSIYTRPLSDFPVAHCPGYRRYGMLQADEMTSSEDPQGLPMGPDEWEHVLAADIETLVSQILTHVCGESCYKYTKAKCTRICRHGFYHVVHLADDWKRRRQGKHLRNALFVVKQTEYGMQGRILGFQEYPFECLSNYASATLMRSNLDVQDLRRVLPEEHWLHEEEELPSLGSRPDWGYMQHYEWDGKCYVTRHRTSTPAHDPFGWEDDMRPEDWRQLLLELMEQRLSHECSESADPDLEDLLRLSIASFSDGVNTGYYINSYTTKQCPTMEGVLEQLRMGLERLQQQREQEAVLQQAVAAKDPTQLNAEDLKILKGKSSFAEAFRTLNNLSSSYRRMYWKSGTEMLFPILFGHLTFASHRCWTVFVKKGVFMAFEARRKVWGEPVRRAAKKDGDGEMLQHLRPGLPPYPLLGWRRRTLEDGSELLDGPHGETCLTTAEAMSCVLSSMAQDPGSRKSLECIYDMLTGQASAKEDNYACTRHEARTEDAAT